MTYDITVNCYERYRHRYNNKEFMMYGHKLNALINNSLHGVLNKHIHHKNGCKIDNRPENLLLLDESEHHKLEHKLHDHYNPLREFYKEYKTKSYVERFKEGSLKNQDRTKYNKFWDPYHIYYSKAHSSGNDDGFKPRKCFKPKCNGKIIEIGKQLDFVTCEIIHDLVALYSEEEVV